MQFCLLKLYKEKQINIPEAVSSCKKNGGNNSTYITQLLGGLNKVIYAKHLEKSNGTWCTLNEKVAIIMRVVIIIF